MSGPERLKKISFLHIVPFTRDDPGRGLNEALELFEYGEELGLDGAWIRTRHVQYGVPSAATFLAAAAQRTSRIALGTAVIPFVYESPLRLAEDLATADLLSGGRLQPGLSSAVARHGDGVAERLFGPRWRDAALKPYNELERFLDLVRGVPVDQGEHQIGLSPVRELSSDRVEPHSPGLASRLWIGAGSESSTEWAARNDLNLLISNIGSWPGSDVYDEALRLQIDYFRSIHPRGDAAKVSAGYVLVPTDNTSDEQRRKFKKYVQARTPRTERRSDTGRIIAKDFLGSTSEIVERLASDRTIQAADELLFEMPFSFDQEDYRHILREVALNIGPALGWKPQLQALQLA